METEALTFRPREFKGSRLRCLLSTGLETREVAAFLNELVRPHATVSAGDVWKPRGFLDAAEAKLSETPDFLTAAQRATLTTWWLKVPQHANTPNWDLVSTCRMEGRPGLVLVEAKAHGGELHNAGKPHGHAGNDETIAAAIAEANTALDPARGWNLSREVNYQLCNRMAWAWKVASLGVPVVLAYLGFLNALEMGDARFSTHEHWLQSLLDHARGTVPESAWEQPHRVGDGWFVPLVRSAIVATTIVVRR
jgi:hypothetical protein